MAGVFQQVLTAFPHVAEGPFKAKPDCPPRSAGPERDRLFVAWCQGQTGYPIVDAGMRQLNKTGWMHNRVRMIVASFLVKDLRLDWRSGERYFMEQLVDGDLAANNGNWQWCASTGTDAMQGYRILTPPFKVRSSIQTGVCAPVCPGTESGTDQVDSRTVAHAARRNRCGLDAASASTTRNRSSIIGRRVRNIWISANSRWPRDVATLRLGISRCLLGEQVRFDGGHKRTSFLTEVLGRYVEWVPVCPEVEAGTRHAA